MTQARLELEQTNYLTYLTTNFPLGLGLLDFYTKVITISQVKLPSQQRQRKV